MAKAAFLAAVLPKSSSKSPKGDAEEGSEDAPESKKEPSADYRALMKEAAADGDWEGFVEALCAYVDK